MAKIEVGRFSQLMRRYLAMAGVVEVAGELAPEISPVFVLESERPEWEFLKGQKLCSSQISVTPVAGQPSSGRLRNPPDSGVIAIINKTSWSVDIARATVLISRLITTADLAVVVQTVTRDTRYGALNTSALIASQANTGLVGDFFFNCLNADEGPFWVDLDFVLTPGFAVELNSTTFNTFLRGNFHWIERKIGEMEVG